MHPADDGPTRTTRKDQTGDTASRGHRDRAKNSYIFPSENRYVRCDSIQELNVCFGQSAMTIISSPLLRYVLLLTIRVETTTVLYTTYKYRLPLRLHDAFIMSFWPRILFTFSVRIIIQINVIYITGRRGMHAPGMCQSSVWKMRVASKRDTAAVSGDVIITVWVLVCPEMTVWLLLIVWIKSSLCFSGYS